MKDREARKRILKSFCAAFLAFVMLFTNVMGAAEVHAAGSGLKAPKINPVSPGVTEITGAGLIGFNQRKAKNAVCNIIVTVRDANDVVKETKTFTIRPTEKQPKGSAWSVTLNNPVQEGYKVYAKQEFNGGTSEEVFVEVKKSLAVQYKDQLKMPELEVWSEDLHVIESDAVDDIVNAFKAENNTLTEIGGKNFEKNATSITVAGDGKSITITFSDGSKIENIDISDKVTVKQITEVSTAPNINTLKVTDGTITGKVDLKNVAEPTRLRVEIVTSFGETKPSDFCSDQGCSIDKGAKVFATVNPDTGEFSYDIGNDNVVLGKDYGVIVKEYRKKNNCSTIQPELVIPKVDVRDPKKLSDDEKKTIEAKIREANTVNGKSKLPDGTGFYDGIPAFIEFDKDENVKIINPSAVEGDWDWDNGGKFVPETNKDGSYKLKEGAKPTTIPAKDLLKNLKPDAPTLALSEDKKNITITPNLEVDTDAHIITVSYKGTDGNDKTAKATKDNDGKWSVTEGEGIVDENTGVFTLEISKIKEATKLTAKVTDNGGLEGDTDELESDESEIQITKANKVEALGGLDPVDIKKWVGDKVEWKDGIKAKDSATDKSKISELLKGATFEDVTETKRSTDKSGEFEGEVKVKFDDDSEIIVEKQMLYVSDAVSPSDKKNLPEDAIDVELKLDEGVKAGDKTGNKETPVTAKSYKVKPGTDLSTEKVSGTENTCFDEIGATVTDDTYVDVTWNDKDKGTNFVATAGNNVFTATATKKFKVTVQANGGTGDDKVEFKKKDESFTLPAKDTYTPPNENQEFSGWQVGEDSKNLKKAGDEITITGDTVVKAIWKPIEFKVDFKAGEGASGTMKDEIVTKGSEFVLPDPTFTAPKDKVFAGWKVGSENGVQQAKEKITITGNITLTATWKDIQVKVTYDANGGSGTMEGTTLTKGSTYKLLANGFTAPENKKFKGWQISETEYAPDAEITVNEDTTVTAIWEDVQIKVTYNANGGSGEMMGAELTKGSTYKLLANGFTAPENQEFKTWEVDGKEVAAGTEITVDKDTEVKAIWKDIMVDVTFDGNGGGGSMDKATVKKGNEYELPENGFEAPKDKVFDGWMVGTEKKSVGDTITVNGDTEVKAVWKDKVTTTPDPSKPNQPTSNAPSDNGGNYLILEKVEPKDPSGQWETGRHYKYLYGYPDGSVRPEGQITRAEAAGLIARLAELDLSNKEKPDFKDTPSRWYNSAINVMVAKDLMFGDKNGNFRPNEPITRGEFARALYYIDTKNDKVAPFEDVKGHEFEAAINQAYGNGRIAGYPDGSFKPDAYIQRAEAARMLNQYADRGVTLEGMAGVKKDVIRFTDINESHWAYYEVMEAANTHDYRRAKGRLNETWLRIIQDDNRVAR